MDAKKVSFAPLPEVIAATGMEFGSITPVGLPENWAVLIDSSVLQLENVMISGGLAKD
ncbi:YbaK/EbsC family protein [Kingella negevensis]|uniref:YbaK/EbsC family protein n=1 Tax=Kingella negevensis TaxID=1522312 RepID=UPI0015D9D4E7|nr:YbaK/EbsC family protein [Kingella negevensis]MDK4679238.1 YbaK/EbsC family protein [Kingella negevensis]MDK4683040.1 YbaK/EbsC family protein [Kingella negevensis]MDK4683771.1 YbaK/EbsC family protein [Kingella negevensis]MDK4691240.1 YbaK/EbsC family protein [Kingella negevensis]MDK4693612.1 YbaK/EbsC family protein [Kingella negevensis]